MESKFLKKFQKIIAKSQSGSNKDIEGEKRGDAYGHGKAAGGALRLSAV
jgi:hypothetical protein